MKISVLISTYNNPVALEKTLWGYRYQTSGQFEVVIADDGSRDETRELIQSIQRDFPRPIQHVWHEDRGFQKNEIMNKAIIAATGDYIVVTDGDCIPRDDFVDAHRTSARPGMFLCGGSHIDLPVSIHKRLVEEDVASGRLFDHGWLCSQGLPEEKYWLRLTRNRWLAAALNLATPRRTVLIGCNASFWKCDAMAVNGFDTSWSYGAEDQEMGVRMTNHGVKSRRLKYSLVCAHLSHARSEQQEEQRMRNKRRLSKLRWAGTTWVESGIKAA